MILYLDKVWINRLDTGESFSAYSGDDRERQKFHDGNVELYAGGRLRSYSLAGEQGQFTITLRELSLDAIAQLESWIGIAVVVRDHRGQRFFGVYFAVQTAAMKEIGYYTAAIQLRLISYNEAV